MTYSPEWLLDVEVFLTAVASSALTTNVTPNMRALYVDFMPNFTEPDLLKLIFYYDKNPDELEKELNEDTFSYFVCAFAVNKYEFSYDVIVLPTPEKIADNRICAYLRYEGPAMGLISPLNRLLANYAPRQFNFTLRHLKNIWKMLT